MIERPPVMKLVAIVSFDLSTLDIPEVKILFFENSKNKSNLF